MELEFDKEIDAILRKARAPAGAAVTTVPAAHLDADAVAAFAENALPNRAKQLYMEHFADCDRCRRMLSQSIILNSGAVAANEGAASPIVSVPSVPWYLKIFRTPNLALAMGALVLTFGGVLGYLVLQNRSEGNSASVAKVTEQEQNHGTYSGSEPAANTATANSANVSIANSVANIPPVPNAPASNPVPSASGPTALADPNLAGRNDAPGSSGTGSSGNPAKTGDVLPADAKPVTAAPPPPSVAQPMLDRDEKKAGEDKEKLKDDARQRVMSKTEATDLYSRDSLSNAKKMGPNRASGPRNVQQQEMNTQSVVGMIAPTKTAGGKTFENRNGAWYDTAYHGQATTNVRRGTDKYKKLDDRLRSIADSIGGTIVLVWKEKAYRIQ